MHAMRQRSIWRAGVGRPHRRRCMRAHLSWLPSFIPCLPPRAGGLLDYEAVKEGLSSGQVAGLGLDVQGQEPVPPGDWLAHHPCVYLTPHIAGVTEVSCECRWARWRAQAGRAGGQAGGQEAPDWRAPD